MTLPSALAAAHPRCSLIVDIPKLLKIAAWVAVIGFTIAVFVVGGAAVVALF
jgi:hypothetical protein